MKLHPIRPPSGLKPSAPNCSALPAAAHALRAMTLPELMVGIAVGSLILMVIAMVFMTSTRGFAAMSDYVSMDAHSRNALDHMSLQIRQVGALSEFSPTHLKFTAPGQPNTFLVYDWDSASGRLTEWKTGDLTTNTLLTDCTQLAFSRYNSSFTLTTNLSDTKGLSVSWKCARTTFGNTSTTEDMQQALIVIRN